MSVESVSLPPQEIRKREWTYVTEELPRINIERDCLTERVEWI